MLSYFIWKLICERERERERFSEHYVVILYLKANLGEREREMLSYFIWKLI